MKIIYSGISFISGLIVLDIILSFLGLSPLNEGGGLFLFSDKWHYASIISIATFGISTSKLISKKQSDTTRPIRKPELLVLGICLILGAVPAGFMTELSVNGCCGASSTGYEGVGYVLMGVMVVGGIASIYFSKKRRSKINQ